MQTRIEVSAEAIALALDAHDRADEQFVGAPADRRASAMKHALQAAASATDSTTVPMGDFLTAPGDSVIKALAEVTGPEVAGIAARGLHSPHTLTHDEIKKLAGSCLTQVPNHAA